MSPIKGLSENRRLIRLGKLHLGIKVEKIDPKTNKPALNARGEVITYPKATNYFVCPPEVKAVYGEQPDRLDVIIPVEDDEMWCNQYYRRYSRTRGLTCKGNGETCRRMIDRQTGAIAGRDTKEVVWKDDLPCPGRACPDYQGKKCQEVMNLQFLLPRVPGLGIWQIDTGSINSIRNINDNAAMLRAVCDRVSWIPLTLTLEPKEVVNPDDGRKKVVRCLNIRHDRGLLELLAASEKPRATLLISPPLEDQQPLDEIPDDDIIEGEVVPPSQPKKAAKKAAKVQPEQVVDVQTGEIISQKPEEEPPVPEQPEQETEELWPEDIPGTGEVPPVKPVQTTAGPSQAEPEPTEEKKGFIDMDWLKESLKTLQSKQLKAWSESNLLSYIKTTYKVEGKTVLEAAAKLDLNQSKHFTRRIEDTLQMM